jgi:hypothetical protein
MSSAFLLKIFFVANSLFLNVNVEITVTVK